ncbi:SDR family oxidoreductase [Streptomyces noursei]|uniref:SDR family oxidoreductase n=1 Tax=Streptomyces noursei TaxID=1971 RepID=UPI00081CB13B|nr:SDR family oxidoreductase [Streptomyces noursei]ANZ20614.1 putative short chain dehydrogenase [Streptomyces noursei ATCC 11455]MCZ1013500.1 SDR family oxidoreductase [Streptomyces noursei]GGX35922.1 short-chain dehydrogenase [Streptomyces noursei]
MSEIRVTADIPKELAGKRAVVTGGSRGIGAAIVQHFLDAGASVVTSARSATEDTPSAATFVKADLSTRDGVREFADAALDTLGGVDIVVNNAGGCRAFQSALDIENDWQYTMDINFLAAVRLNSALVPAMRESGGGAIVHVSSIATISSYPMILHYAAAKSALETYSKGLAAQLAPEGIRVVAVSLGNVMTPGADEAREKIVDYLGAESEEWADEIPLGRLGQPRDIAEAVGFLASPRAAWITGSSLVIDGGKIAAL